MSTWERGEAVRAALLDRKPPVVTLSLVFINVMVFCAGLVLAYQRKVPLNLYVAGSGDRNTSAADAEKIWEIQWQTGAVQRIDIYPGNEWWRLLTCCFVHIGLLHLGMNMLSLFIIGPLLERLWGHVRFLVLYLVTGVCGSAAMVMLFSSPFGSGAGASGAIWGISASLLTWILLNKHALPAPVVASWMRWVLIVFAFNIWFTFSHPQISASAHFGGGIAGLVVSVPLNYLGFARGWRWGLALAGVMAVPLISLAMLVQALHKDHELLERAYRLNEFRKELMKLNSR